MDSFPFSVLLSYFVAWVHVLATRVHVEASPAPVPWWTVAGAVAALLAVLVALFRDEVWHWVHAARLEVELVDSGVVRGVELELQVRNTSKRTAAEEVSVRIVELEPHPLQASIGPRWVGQLVQVDLLLSRRGGETSSSIAPQGEACFPFAKLHDAGKSSDPVLADIANLPKQGIVPLYDAHGLLVLPSADDRKLWTEGRPDLAMIMDAPAMIRLEVAAKNVPAKLYTVKLHRAPDAPVADELPLNPGLRANVFTHELVEGSAPYNRVLRGE